MTWQSESESYRDSNGNVMQGVKNYVFDATTDANGLFSVDASSLNLSNVLSARALTLGQSVTSSTNPSSLLIANVISISTTTITGVILKGVSLTVSVGASIDTVSKGGSGVSVRVIVTAF